MNWEAISAITEVLGLVAVIATVIYLAMQIRQSTRSIQGNTEQVLMSQEIEVYRMAADYAGVFRRGRDDVENLDEDEKMAFFYIVAAQMSQYYSGFVQNHRGLIPDHVWLAYETAMLKDLAQPGFLKIWGKMEDDYPEDFRHMVQSKLG